MKITIWAPDKVVLVLKLVAGILHEPAHLVMCIEHTGNESRLTRKRS